MIFPPAQNSKCKGKVNKSSSGLAALQPWGLGALVPRRGDLALDPGRLLCYAACLLVRDPPPPTSTLLSSRAVAEERVHVQLEGLTGLGCDPGEGREMGMGSAVCYGGLETGLSLCASGAAWGLISYRTVQYGENVRGLQNRKMSVYPATCVLSFPAQVSK
jgi:hypothetical protein